jgi:transcriptional regulator with XRE-family HTH domain
MGVVTMARYQIGKVAAEEGMTIYRLARKAGVNEARLRLIVNNRVENVTVRTLEQIAIALGRPLAEIFEPASLYEVPRIPNGAQADSLGEDESDNSTNYLDSAMEG